ncbi:hypothetical protein U4E84_17395 [Halorubrum sp. AD140]|uniref:hypothetical protein n=1 Tax=Halorubrum sp. AD140 TaxID=3050073 RepID=UPI002ACCC354|nr:hypothetical protein [Halorubrum sp. AD140]MDZ5813111.1 hypothetical protein [Halorubrum sp. AD140]
MSDDDEHHIKLRSGLPTSHHKPELVEIYFTQGIPLAYNHSMIKFTEGEEEYYFDPEGPATNYHGDSEVLIKNLANIESLAYELEAPESRIEEVDDRRTAQEKRVYDPEAAVSIIRSTIQHLDGVEECDYEDS